MLFIYVLLYALISCRPNSISHALLQILRLIHPYVIALLIKLIVFSYYIHIDKPHLFQLGKHT